MKFNYSVFVLSLICSILLLLPTCTKKIASDSGMESDKKNIEKPWPYNIELPSLTEQITNLEKQMQLPEDKAILFLSLSYNSFIKIINKLEEPERNRIKKETIELLEKYIQEHSENDNQWIYPFLGYAYGILGNAYRIGSLEQLEKQKHLQK